MLLLLLSFSVGLLFLCHMLCSANTISSNTTATIIAAYSPFVHLSCPLTLNNFVYCWELKLNLSFKSLLFRFVVLFCGDYKIIFTGLLFKNLQLFLLLLDTIICEWNLLLNSCSYQQAFCEHQLKGKGKSFTL